MLIKQINARYVHMKDADVITTTYSDGSLALIGKDTDEDGIPNMETFSINLGSAFGLIPPKGHVYVKDYSENEGLAVELDRLGVVTIVERITFGPHGSPAFLVKIADSILSEVK